MGSVEGAVEVGESNIYNYIGSAFKESANDDVAAFLSVVGCEYLIGVSAGGSVVVVVVLLLMGCPVGRIMEVGVWERTGSMVMAVGGNISVAIAPSSWRISL
jgi:hypothetical protein